MGQPELASPVERAGPGQARRFRSGGHAPWQLGEMRGERPVPAPACGRDG